MTARALSVVVLVMALSISGSAADFDNEVLPILTKAGCNAGSCHGAAIGRGGFQLSLYGQDPALDWERITRDFGGRRLNRIEPEMSLLLRKAGEFTDHGGGAALDPLSDDWETLREWISQGAPRRAAAPPPVAPVPAFVSLRTEPRRFVAPAAADAELQIRVLASRDDGSEQDVTRWAILTPLDPQAILVGDPPGSVRIERPGRHVLLVRVRDLTTAVELLRPLDRSADRSTEQATVAEKDRSLVDRFIDRRLAELGIAPLGAVDDAAFLRRTNLDLTGRLPTPAEVRQFIADTSPDKRLQHIDGLLQSPAATEYWTHRLLVMLRADGLQGRGREATVGESYRAFIRSHVERGTPLPEILAQLVTASGTPAENGAVGFYLSAADARGQTELFSEIVMGSRMRCANCHDHPLDHWTQEDYHGLAALFAGVRRDEQVQWYPGATNINPASGEPAAGRLPDGTEISIDADPRPLLAEYVRGDGARTVARAWANRFWAELFGRGLCEPTDDLRESNPATHPELLEALVVDWEQHDYDLRYLIRELTRSDAYARRGELRLPESGQGDPLVQAQAAHFYAVRTARPLTIPVLLDALDDVTQNDVTGLDTDGGAGPRRRIGQSPFTAVGSARQGAGVSDRCGTPAGCPEDFQDSLSGRLAVIAGPLVNDRIRAPESYVRRWTDPAAAHPAAVDPSTAIEQIYLRCLSRFPTAEEREYWSAHLNRSDAYREAVEDMVWSLLTSRQFTMNH